jgi:hypothetical protein
MANVFKAIGNFFKKVFGFVIKSDPFKHLLAELLPVAISVVSSLASVSVLSSAEKRNQAFGALVVAAKEKGLEFSDHMLNLLIELAVAKLKGTIAVE